MKERTEDSVEASANMPVVNNGQFTNNEETKMRQKVKKMYWE